MSFKLKLERPAAAEIGRIGREELDAAISEFGDGSNVGSEATHDVRKRLKKLRGLLRLVRTTDRRFYRRENARFRDTARNLAAVRDRTALIEALDALAVRFQDDASSKELGPLRQVLEEKRQHAIDNDAANSFDDVAGSLKSARQDWDDWEVSKVTQAGHEALLDGLEENYRRARMGLKSVKRHGDTHAFHELRKRVKYHAMHLKLLSHAWPESMGPVRKVADAVADDLGRDHDYAVMRAEFATDPAAYGSVGNLQTATVMMDAYQDELRNSALLACERLFQEKPKAFRRRIKGYICSSSGRGPGSDHLQWQAGEKQADQE